MRPVHSFQIKLTIQAFCECDKNNIVYVVFITRKNVKKRYNFLVSVFLLTEFPPRRGFS